MEVGSHRRWVGEQPTALEDRSRILGRLEERPTVPGRLPGARAAAAETARRAAWGLKDPSDPATCEWSRSRGSGSWASQPGSAAWHLEGGRAPGVATVGLTTAGGRVAAAAATLVAPTLGAPGARGGLLWRLRVLLRRQGGGRLAAAGAGGRSRQPHRDTMKAIGLRGKLD